MVIKLKSIPEHDYRVIVVPGHLIEKPLAEYHEINVGGDIYEIHETITHRKGETMSNGLALLATGKYFNDDDVFKKYKKSNRIVFFICKLVK